ncbi:Fungal lipase-like domain containing protein [Heracleum sosnowskyi]|uniref:Fungal lipase-like domain containing protein n=1 Tax=Heracleum sosnowskyi TaxID=360622 RepID=A0AAD8IE18_9APIA|nr:Fungal lipase-like domain containing protein [Heracleum sosnowskyi]
MARSCSKEFASNYMLLSPQNLGFLDIFYILFSKDLKNRTFIDCSEGTREESCRRRWIIFASIVAQKLLFLLAKPLALLGSKVEYWLNLVSSNGGFFALVLNYLQGKVVEPNIESASFFSVTEYTDKRVDLDQNIKPGDWRYLSVLSIMAAKASYENKAYLETIVRDHWKMELLGSFNFWNDYQEKATTQAFMCRETRGDEELIVVSFRGTEVFDADAWSSDVDLSWYELHCGVGKVHGGFLKALGLQKSLGFPKEIEQVDNKPVAYYFIRNMLRELLSANKNAKFIVTGHSLGGALAILFPGILAFHKEDLLLERLQGVYTFGQPRVGDAKFGKFMEEQLKNNSIRYFRTVYCNDIVPRLPFDDNNFMFKHFGECLYINSFYEGQIVAEEPNKNYFSLLDAIPKSANAVWELARSFIIPYTRGTEYKEGALLRVIRVVGVLVPGISAHIPQNYVNASRLVSSGVLDIDD